MSGIRLRTIERDDFPAVAELIYVSTNAWYQSNGRPPIFSGGPYATMVFCEVYQDLDPGACLLAEHETTGRLMGSCFVHPRETHISLGIMNVHPAYFGCGVARRLLSRIIEMGHQQQKPVRLVSSAVNLDSFSLYTRAGFVPRQTYQDVFLAVSKTGFAQRPPGIDQVRPARANDVTAMAALERELCGIDRRDDFGYLIENRGGIWSASVIEDGGTVAGFLFSIQHPGCNMLGPGAARSESQAAALIAAELDKHRGRSPVFLLPVQCGELVKTVYRWGGRNCEMHVHQVLGESQRFQGICMPTFLPETA